MLQRGAFSQFSKSLHLPGKMAVFPLPVLQIWWSQKQVANQIQLMNIHVSECKCCCVHLISKFGGVWNCQNWWLHWTDEIYDGSTVLLNPFIKTYWIDENKTNENTNTIILISFHLMLSYPDWLHLVPSLQLSPCHLSLCPYDTHLPASMHISTSQGLARHIALQYSHHTPPLISLELPRTAKIMAHTGSIPKLICR